MSRILLLVSLLVVLGSSCLQNLSGVPYPACDETRTDEEACSEAGATCGEIAIEECGASRVVNCGGCPDPNVCNDDKTCSCPAIDDDVYCGLVNAECGTVSGTDPCGTPRAVSCGKCDDTDSCVGNRCVCEGITDEELCVNHGAECGPLSVMDGCGELRDIMCGSCDDQETCGSDNLCSCTPESDEELCARNLVDCDIVNRPLMDNCGVERTGVDCGTCSAAQGLTCGGGGTPNVCGCEGSPDADLCTTAGANCGSPILEDACGNMRPVVCGTCMSPETCGGADVEFQCGCTNETAEQFCTRRGFECGVVNNEVDNCGDPVNGVNCGECTDPDECGIAAANRCTCRPEEQAEFCQNQNAECGSVSGMDQCGNMRTTFCGQCPAGERCANSGNLCECAPETDAQFCSRLNACGTITAPNNCGTSVTVPCGACPNGACSSDGQCTNCTPESNTQFCNRLGFNCGNASGVDNCGTMRTGVNCGSCVSPFSCEENVCLCEAEEQEDDVYCDGALADCGTIFFLDECNVEQSANCGVCQNSVDSCIGNKCVCIPETGPELCAAAGANCGSINVTDRCGMPRSPSCGTCSGIKVCLGNQCVGL